MDINHSQITKDDENNLSKYFFRASANDFKKIPGSPIAYWASDRVREIFAVGKSLGEIAVPCVGLQTGDNNCFLRLWYEVGNANIGFALSSREAALASQKKWFPYNKGGEFRKWFGNNEYLVNWENDGHEIINFVENGKQRSRPQNTQYYFKPAITWSFVSSAYFGVRQSDEGFVFDVGGSSAFPSSEQRSMIIGFLCTKIAFQLMKTLNPTLNFQVGNIASLPFLKNEILKHKEQIDPIAQNLIHLSRTDWDSYETSWDFTTFPLLNPDHHKSTLSETYASLRQQWVDNTLEMQRLEEENNRLFIDAYGLQDELTPEVPLNEITLTCNPYYRYGKTAPAQSGFPLDGDLENRLRSDTMRELLSYGVGCMMGRYSLDKPGLILANAGETLVDFVEKVSASTPLNVTTDTSAPLSDRVVTTGELSFQPDADGIIPILDGEWSQDDIVARTRDFLSAAFGADYLAQNVRFIEDALGRDLRKYFLTDFYKDHLQTYKKRPIYWLVQSPKKGFSCLIYLHRYTRDTINVVLNRYLRDYQNKLRHHIAHLQHTETTATTPREKTAARKQADKLTKVLHECEDWEREVLLPLAQARIELDLDDGVKVNYGKLGAALAGIPGMGGSG